MTPENFQIYFSRVDGKCRRRTYGDGAMVSDDTFDTFQQALIETAEEILFGAENALGNTSPVDLP